MLVLRGPFRGVTLILRFPAGQFAQLQIDALAELLPMPDQLAIGLVHDLHQQIVVGRVWDARLGGRRVRFHALPTTVSAVLLPFRQRAHQIELRISVTSVLKGRASRIPSRRVASQRLGIPISSHRVEITVTASHQIEIALLIPAIIRISLAETRFCLIFSLVIILFARFKVWIKIFVGLFVNLDKNYFTTVSLNELHSPNTSNSLFD